MDVSKTGLNDLNAGLFYQFMHEGNGMPSMIAHGLLRAPTGDAPDETVKL